MPTKLPLDESTLISLLKKDSEYAFQLLFEHYHNLVYKVALLYVKSPTLAQDIVQDVFMKIWFQRNNLPDVISFESWIYTLSRNLTINCLKKLAYEGKARAAFNKDQNGFDDTTDHKIRNSQYNALLQQAIHQLPEQQQKVYRRQFTGMKLTNSPAGYTKFPVDNEGYFLLHKRNFKKGVNELWPIPQSERDINKNLTQNDGY